MDDRLYWTAFEDFVLDVLYPAALGLYPEAARHARFLTAAQADDDGTYPYAFVFDPYFEDVEYDIEVTLTKAYGAERAAAYMRDLATYYDRYARTEFRQGP